MTAQIGVAKPPSFYEDIIEHLRQIADYVKAAGDRANATVPKDGSEATEMVKYTHKEVAMSSNLNDLDLDGFSVVRFTLTAAFDLTGIVAGDGRWLLIINTSSAANTLTLEDEDVLSLAANRLKRGAPLLLAQNDTAVLWYDPIDTRWRKVSI